jgi:hypothetical protein
MCWGAMTHACGFSSACGCHRAKSCYMLTWHSTHSLFRVAQVLTLVSRAHHDANEHDAAKRALLRGLHMFPTDLKLRFNLAFVLQVCANRGRDVNIGHRSSPT